MNEVNMNERDLASVTELPPPLPPRSTVKLVHEPASRYQFAPLPDGCGWNGVLSALLRQPGQIVYQLHQSAAAWRVTAVLAVIALLCLVAYGVVVGGFSGGT